MYVSLLKIFAVGTFIFLSMSGCSTSRAQRTMGMAEATLNPNFEVQGHRGARWVRPENTMSAFRYALEQGVDTLEMDLLVTKDDKLVIHHDPVLNRAICLDPRGKRITRDIPIRSLKLKDLKRYDCGTLVNPKFPEQVAQPGERIPTFEELLVWLEESTDPRAKSVKLNVETKSEEAHPEYSPDPKAFASRVVHAFRKHKVLDRVTLQSFDFRTLAAARELEPNLVISLLLEERPKESLGELIQRYRANILSPYYLGITKEDVAQLHAVGVKVLPWTPNKREDWQNLYEMGVDGMISDNPKALLEYRASLGGRAP